MSYAVRGQKPDRLVKAALAGALINGLKALTKGENPLPRIVYGAVTSPVAQDPHLLNDRAKRQKFFDDHADDAMKAYGALRDAARSPAPPALPPTPKIDPAIPLMVQQIAPALQQAAQLRAAGWSVVRVTIPLSMWDTLTVEMRKTILDAAVAPGIAVEVPDNDTVVRVFYDNAH
jgi:hypothetical protein